MLINDAGTMRQTSVETLATYMGTKGLGPAYTRAASPPGSPNAGDWWYDTGRDESLYIYDSTLGWLTSTGTGHYLVNGSFSIEFTGGALKRTGFEGEALGTTANTSISIPAIYQGTAESTWALSNSVRGVFCGSQSGDYNDSARKHAAFIVMATNADAVDFGDLTVNRSSGIQCTSHATRGVIAGGTNPSNVMDYITIASAGDATDFGNLTVARYDLASQAMSSTTRSIFSGGFTGSSSLNTLDYITVASTGNATDFGDLSGNARAGACANSTTRGLHAGGTEKSTSIDYVTIGTTGNASDFGDLLNGTNNRVAVHSSTKAYFHAGAEQVTMATAANSTASGFTLYSDNSTFAVMPGWIAANG